MMTVLVFHAVTDGAWFEALVQRLAKHYTLVPVERVSEYRAGDRSPRPECHITTDDGDKSFASVMLPVLVKYRVPSSLFASPRICLEGSNFWFQDVQRCDPLALTRIAAEVLKVPLEVLVAFTPYVFFKAMPREVMEQVLTRYRHCYGAPWQTPRNLSAKELQEIAATGLVTIGGHTVSHPILGNENDASSAFEISASLDGLAEILGQKIEYFAYPNGIAGIDFGEREEELLAAKGVKLAFTTESRHVSPGDSPTRIPRIAISDGEQFSRVAAKLLLGSHWGRMRRLARGGEYQQRTRLRQALDNYSCSSAHAGQLSDLGEGHSQTPPA